MSGVFYLGTVLIDERRLRYDAVPFQARLRITLTGPGIGQPGEALGSVIALDTDAPGLRVSAPLHLEWARSNREAIVAEAIGIWAALQRICGG